MIELRDCDVRFVADRLVPMPSSPAPYRAAFVDEMVSKPHSQTRITVIRMGARKKSPVSFSLRYERETTTGTVVRLPRCMGGNSHESNRPSGHPFFGRVRRATTARLPVHWSAMRSQRRLLLLAGLPVWSMHGSLDMSKPREHVRINSRLLSRPRLSALRCDLCPGSAR